MTELGEGAQEPEREWRLIAPEGEPSLRRIEGEMAFHAMASALGWQLKEVKRPTETDLSEQEIVDTSKELFGDERYGKFANDFLSWLSEGASGEIYHPIGGAHRFSFTDSRFWLKYPTFESRIGVESYASNTEIRRAVVPVLDAMNLPFRYKFHFYPSFRYGSKYDTYGQAYLVARPKPEAVTKERLQRFLTAPVGKNGATYAEHGLHGILGRALDTLIVASGLRDDVDTAATQIEGEPVKLEEFTNFAERNGVSKSILRTMNDKLKLALMDQLIHLRTPAWGEVVTEGDSALWYGKPGFRDLYVDAVSIDTLARVDQSYTRINPILQSLLDAYKSAPPSLDLDGYGQ